MDTATVTHKNESYGPLRRYDEGDQVSGPEADRLTALGLAEYNEVKSTDDSAGDSTDNPEQKES